VPPRHRKDGPQYEGGNPESTRNTLAVIASPDLIHWNIRSVIIYHPDTRRHGFQYADWQFDGNDIVGAVRTSFDDSEGGAHDMHDANYLTFHRVKDFRDLLSGATRDPWQILEVQLDDSAK
jgi:hypothetical protein